jgi:hypothetical protein
MHQNQHRGVIGYRDRKGGVIDVTETQWGARLEGARIDAVQARHDG